MKVFANGKTFATADVELTLYSELLNPATLMVALGLRPFPDIVNVLPL